MSESLQRAAPTPTGGGGLGTGVPKRGPRHPARDQAEHAVARLAILLFQLMPEAVARGIGQCLGWLGWFIFRRYRRQILRHMDIAFRDEFSRTQKERWCRQNFEHVALSLVEFSRMPLLTKNNLDRLIDLSQCKVIGDLIARNNGKGLLCVPAHHGNWELCGYACSLVGYPLKSVARPLDNPLLNEMVDEMRQVSGNEIIHKWKVLWKLKKLLDHGNMVTMSVDQNGGAAGLFVPLFGALASTVASPAELHLATGAPILVATLNRQADGIHHVFHVWDVIELAKSGDYDADRKAVVTRINAAYEKAIRAYPEQWLWVHKRWKTRPPGEQPGPDGLPPRIG